MPDRIAGYVRTIWPLVLGHLAAFLAAWVGARVGITVDATWVYELLAVALVTVIYAGGRWLEVRPGTSTPARVARAVGHWVLSLGLPTGPPSYPLTTGPPPASPVVPR
jgi:hypothetical protein